MAMPGERRLAVIRVCNAQQSVEPVAGFAMLCCLAVSNDQGVPIRSMSMTTSATTRSSNWVTFAAPPRNQTKGGAR